MARTKEVSVSPKGFFGFFRGIGLIVVDIYNRGQPTVKRRTGKWKCMCGRKYDTIPEIDACKKRIHQDIDPQDAA